MEDILQKLYRNELMKMSEYILLNKIKETKATRIANNEVMKAIAEPSKKTVFIKTIFNISPKLLAIVWRIRKIILGY